MNFLYDEKQDKHVLLTISFIQRGIDDLRIN